MSDDPSRAPDARWHWSQRADVVGRDPPTPAGRLRVLAQGAAEVAAGELAAAREGFEHDPPRLAYYCRGAGAPVVACATDAAFAAAQHAPPLRRTGH